MATSDAGWWSRYWVVEHLDRLRRTGAPTGPDDYLNPNLNGNRMDYGRVEQIVRDAAKLASEQLAKKSLPPLPNTTPHTLRRTYISIALLAYEWDVKYVMDQVGSRRLEDDPGRLRAAAAARQARQRGQVRQARPRGPHAPEQDARGALKAVDWDRSPQTHHQPAYPTGYHLHQPADLQDILQWS